MLRTSGAKQLGRVLLAALLAGSQSAAGADAEGPEIVPPRPTAKGDIDYPREGEGDAIVRLELTIDPEGDVSDIIVLEGDEPFRSAAIRAARSWRFSPATEGGKATAARIRFEVRFVEPKGNASATDKEPARAALPATAASSDPAPEDTRTEIVVRGQRKSAAESLTRAEVRQLPGAFGDPFRAIESRPGVTPIGTGLPYFYVRGAPPGNVGYFIDGVRVPGLFHVAVGPSVLHPALIGNVQLHRGPFPARYGRFTGGIVAAESAPPGDDFGGEASIRLVDAGAFVEAPFDGGRGHAAVSGRYSYTAAVLGLVVPELDLAYWDYQARASHRLSGDDTVSLFSFGSYDFAAQTEDGDRTTLFDVGFHRLDLRYDRALGHDGNLRVAATLGRDDSTIEEGQVTVQDDLVGLRLELQQPLGASTSFRAGADVWLDHYDLVAEPDSTAEGGFEDVDDLARLLPARRDVTTGTWAEVDVAVTEKITLTPGIRLDVFGSGDTHAVGVDPRVAARVVLSDDVALVHGLGLSHQRPSFVIPVPGAQPVLDRLQRTVHSSYGLEWVLPDDIELSATVYQSIHFGLTDSLGISRLDNGVSDVDEETRMRGHTYGIELLAERSLTRRLGGYLSYTLSRSVRAAGPVRGPSAFDRRHVLGAALAYDLGRRWRAGARAMFYTGTPADVAYVEAARDPPRTDPFWRLDWRIEKSWLIGSDGAFWALVLEVLNTTLNREQITASCSAYVCRGESFGPVTVPSFGAEVAF